MPFAEAFDQWDPLDEAQLPSWLPTILLRERDRACAVLESRTRQHLMDASSSIHRLSYVSFIQSAIADIEAIEAAGRRRGYLSAFKAFQHAVEHVDLSDYPLFDGARKADYYAVLALSAIGEIIIHRAEDDARIPKDERRTHPGQSAVEELTIIAVEANGYAEHLIREKKIESTTKRRHGRPGSRGKRERFKPLKDECIRRYKAYGLFDKSNQKAAERIYDSLEPEFRSLFQSQDELQRIRSIAFWIGNHKKETRQ